MAHLDDRLFNTQNHPCCSRCNGLMLDEQVFGIMEFFWTRRCVQCGEMIDILIIQNRNHQEQPGPLKTGPAV